MKDRSLVRFSKMGYSFFVCCFAVSFAILSTSCEHFSLKDDKPEEIIVASYNFEDVIGTWNENSTCCNWSVTLTDKVKRAGKKSARVELRQGDLIVNEPHAELATVPSRNKEGWFAFSVYFPADFVRDTIEESIVQWQSLPDFSAGESWRSPPLLLGVMNDSLVLEIRTDSKKVTPQGSYTFERLVLGPLDKETWLDWVFHIKWAYDNTGVIEIYKNGTMIFSRANQPNSFNDEMYPYLKIGLYKWGWLRTRKTTINSRVIYIDEITIGNEKSGYDMVFPGRP